jgi:hypothetical protein
MIGKNGLNYLRLEGEGFKIRGRPEVDLRLIAFPVSFLPRIKYGVYSSRNLGLVEKIRDPGYRRSPV